MQSRLSLDLNAVRRRFWRLSVAERLAKKSTVDPSTGCKLIGGIKGGHAYGRIMVKGIRKGAHVAAWEEINGPIPIGLNCLHNCPGGDNPRCWNVEHLWIGTHAENMKDRDKKKRRVAPKGEKHWAAKLTEKDVRAIRKDARILREIAADYGVHLCLIWNVQNGKVWKHVK